MINLNRNKMTKAEEILAKYPSVKFGLDDHYGKQTVLNAINEALRIHDVVGRSEQFTCSCGIPPAIRLCEGVQTCLKCGDKLSK